jgi:hypothetical protein
MKNEEAKQILSAYRPGGDDAADPAFEEALEQARRDPELAAWFKEERRRDGEWVRFFQSIPVPEEGKQALLGLARVETAPKKRPFWLWSVGVAAGLALCIGVIGLLIPYLPPSTDLAFDGERSVGVPELLQLAHARQPFDYRGSSVPELRAWLVGRGAPAPEALPEAWGALSPLGCRVFTDEWGHSISLLCLEKNGQIVHLFVAEGRARQALAMAEKEWINHSGWNAYCWSDEDRAYVILSPAPADELDELVI